MPDIWVIGICMLSLMLSVPLVTFCCEVLLGLHEPRSVPASSSKVSVCILVPAHNEAAGIGTTLAQLVAALPEFASILVVADNCSDMTAEIARSHGVHVVERHDTTRRGKGYALACGRDWLRRSPPECVIVLDADCQSDRTSLESLADTALSYGFPVQASYTFEPDLSASSKIQISSFAFWLKNVVRQRGARRMGGAAVLTGTGMAFPWMLFDRIELATGNITEDLALAVDLTRAGRAPIFLESARVVSKAASEEATLAQRSRWEHGFLSVAQRYSLPLLGRGLLLLDRRIFLLGLHLSVPPLALLLTVAGGMALLLACVAAWTDVLLPAAILLSLLNATILCVLLAWLAGGRRFLSARALLMVPLYVLWKIPVYARFLKGERSAWVRTDRTSS